MSEKPTPNEAAGTPMRGGLPEKPDGTPYVLDFGPTRPARARKPGVGRKPRPNNRFAEMLEAMVKDAAEDND